ncbi:helix-turn-helix domain-containing protein [Raineyella sp. W15-4]|uniref:helix-turn-helix domain-containing protein n=1 Tax=Raineyella sp. W15-4 TaxID=3081651 RepID=UPI002953B9BF|nr:helix-turn-helix domain-containing protein [Raineyella sp. W15-4]WOQ17113.1 helix-turn-helix domain-containing protein [Raineyella sp. W15-4]
MSLSLSDVLGNFGPRVEAVVRVDHDPVVSWPYYTNLLDPTPYLHGGELVLTTGPLVDAGFDGSIAAAYVRRLSEVGVAGIVCGPKRIGDPDREDETHLLTELAGECRRQGMPLVWSRQMSFIEMIRDVGALLREDQRETAVWFGEAQRRLTHAALSERGAAAVVEQLGEELDTWVICFDEMARPLHRSARASRLGAPAVAALRERCVGVLDRGIRSGTSLKGPELDAHLQTLGPAHELLGVLAYGSDRQMSEPVRQLITSVVALLSVAMLRSAEVRRARARLDTAVLRLLLSGAVEEARTTTAAWGTLPDPPIVVMAVSSDQLPSSELIRMLGRRAGDRRPFAAEYEGLTVVLLSAQRAAGSIAEAPLEGARIGVSRPVLYDSVTLGHQQAVVALREALSADLPLVRYRPGSVEHMMGAVAAVPGMDEQARRTLEPLTRYDDAHGVDLTRSLAVWLNTGCQWEAAANALNMHRHTLRSRIDRCARILGVDLGDTPTRNGLWVAFTVSSAAEDVGVVDERRTYPHWQASGVAGPDDASLLGGGAALA